MDKKERFIELNCLRIFACILVIISHLDIFKSGIRWNEVNIVEFLNSMLINPKSHLWFIPTMIGVYILSPI